MEHLPAAAGLSRRARLLRPTSRPAAGLARLLALLLLAAPLGAPAAPAAPAPALEEAVQRLETTYRGIRDLKATFQQAAFNKTLNQTIEATGTLYLKKPGKLRWEYTAPTPQEIVSDGKRLWVYTRDLKQVNVSDAPSALAGPAGSFLAGLGQVREHFHPRFLDPGRRVDADGLVVLDLLPKEPQPMLARLVVSVESRTGLVRRAVIHDQLGNTVTVRFLDVAVNPGLADALFAFSPPPGVAVIQQ